MTGDVTEVRPLSPGSGEGPRQLDTRSRRSEEKVGVPSNERAAGPVVPDRAWRLVRTVPRNLSRTRSL